jgi:hypothetical protein
MKINCAAFNKQITLHQDQMIRVVGKINAWYDKVSKTSNQNVAVEKIFKLNNSTSNYQDSFISEIKDNEQK